MKDTLQQCFINCAESELHERKPKHEKLTCGVFSGSWLTQECPDEKLDMENFTLYCLDNLHNFHHGMVVYIHKSVTLQCIHNI